MAVGIAQRERRGSGVGIHVRLVLRPARRYASNGCAHRVTRQVRRGARADEAPCGSFGADLGDPGSGGLNVGNANARQSSLTA
jgi:hypothetical protein